MCSAAFRLFPEFAGAPVCVCGLGGRPGGEWDAKEGEERERKTKECWALLWGLGCAMSTRCGQASGLYKSSQSCLIFKYTKGLLSRTHRREV